MMPMREILDVIAMLAYYSGGALLSIGFIRLVFIGFAAVLLLAMLQ